MVPCCMSEKQTTVGRQERAHKRDMKAKQQADKIIADAIAKARGERPD